MKKIISIMVLCLVCALSFYGCSGKTDTGTEKRRSETVIGKIEAVDGNKITVSIADTSSMSDFERPDGMEKPSGDFGSFDGEMPEGFDPENFNGEMPENFNPENFFGGEIPEGFDPENFGGDGERPEIGEMPEGFENFAGFSGMMNFDSSALTYTGESETFTVPEEMEIGDGDYTSLKVGDVVMITFDQEGGISEITVPSEMKMPTYNKEGTTA